MTAMMSATRAMVRVFTRILLLVVVPRHEEGTSPSPSTASLTLTLHVTNVTRFAPEVCPGSLGRSGRSDLDSLLVGRAVLPVHERLCDRPERPEADGIETALGVGLARVRAHCSRVPIEL